MSNNQFTDFKRFGCRLKLHRRSFAASSPELVMEWSGFKFELFMKWKWYFRYRAALLQIQYPKQFVEIGEFQYMLDVPLEEKIIRKKRELAAQKGEVTKWERIHRENLENPDDLFGIESNPNYQKAIRKLQAKREKRDRLQQEYVALTKILKD